MSGYKICPECQGYGKVTSWGLWSEGRILVCKLCNGKRYVPLTSE